MSSLAAALEQLSTFRTNNSRASQETLKNAKTVILAAGKLGDDGAGFDLAGTCHACQVQTPLCPAGSV